jgi:hypothetical protein
LCFYTVHRHRSAHEHADGAYGDPDGYPVAHGDPNGYPVAHTRSYAHSYTPTRTPTPTASPTPTPESGTCARIPDGATVIDFELLSLNYYRAIIWPARDLEIRTSREGRNQYVVGTTSPYFDLAVAPRRRSGVWRMMGMFVGLPDGQRDAVTVTLRAYNPLGREVASASVTVGPERSPFVHCLMVVAPDIAYVRFFAESARGPASFYFDNLFYVDGEAEEGVCRDTIRITSPANGARLSGRVRVEGELIHSRWPVRVYLAKTG